VSADLPIGPLAHPASTRTRPCSRHPFIRHEPQAQWRSRGPDDQPEIARRASGRSRGQQRRCWTVTGMPASGGRVLAGHEAACQRGSPGRGKRFARRHPPEKHDPKRGCPNRVVGSPARQREEPMSSLDQSVTAMIRSRVLPKSITAARVGRGRGGHCEACHVAICPPDEVEVEAESRRGVFHRPASILTGTLSIACGRTTSLGRDSVKPNALVRMMARRSGGAPNAREMARAR
jgi:hypothetical protein